MNKPKLLVSACLLGTPCRYDGNGKPCAAVLALQERYTLIPVCPECDGGLPTPREPSERVASRVQTRLGADVTAAYERGADIALARAKDNAVIAAVLKERSPSCGSGAIYDGTFSRTLTVGDGVTAERLKANGIPVYGESDIENGGLLGD